MSGDIHDLTPRALPARPDLEFEKARAKRMVRESALSAAAGLETTFHAEPRSRGEVRARAAGGDLKLAEAQLQIAREYGFASWRRLCAYYKTWRLHELSGITGWDLTQKNVQDEVRQLLHSAGNTASVTVARNIPAESMVVATSADAPSPLTQSQLSAIAAFVPRFYGSPNIDIRNATLTETEAQLVVARLRRFPSWQTLQDRIGEIARYARHPKYRGAPDGTDRAKEAVRNRDGDALVHLLATHPDCFYAPSLTDSLRIGPIWDIVTQFMRIGDAATRGLLDRLASAGLNVQQHLNSELLGGPFFRIPAEQIRTLLELGADPNWVTPSGATVLEYAIARYMNGEAVDLIAARVTPRKAFWIAAALGDVATVKTFLNKRGQPTDAARRDRPDVLMLGVLPELTRAQRPDVSDIEILSEAFFLAGLNGRLEAMQLLLDLGVSVDYASGRYPLLYLAVAHEMVDVVEFLLAQKADRDFLAEMRADSVRDLSRRMMKDTERHPNAARIHALLSR